AGQDAGRRRHPLGGIERADGGRTPRHPRIRCATGGPRGARDRSGTDPACHHHRPSGGAGGARGAPRAGHDGERTGSRCPGGARVARTAHPRAPAKRPGPTGAARVEPTPGPDPAFVTSPERITAVVRKSSHAFRLLDLARVTVSGRCHAVVRPVLAGTDGRGTDLSPQGVRPHLLDASAWPLRRVAAQLPGRVVPAAGSPGGEA